MILLNDNKMQDSRKSLAISPPATRPATDFSIKAIMGRSSECQSLRSSPQQLCEGITI